MRLKVLKYGVNTNNIGYANGTVLIADSEETTFVKCCAQKE